MEKAIKSFTVEMEITRSVTVVIEAATEQEARTKASDLDYRHEVVGEITHWVVRKIKPIKQGSSADGR